MPGEQPPSRDATAGEGATYHGEADLSCEAFAKREGGDGSTMHQGLAEARQCARQALRGGLWHGFRLRRADGYGGHAGRGSGRPSSRGFAESRRPHDFDESRLGVTKMDGPSGREFCCWKELVGSVLKKEVALCATPRKPLRG